MDELGWKLIQLVDPDRLRDLTLELLKIPSPTGDEAAVAEHYAQVLRDLGLEVEIDNEAPKSPNVIARLRGANPGPTLEFDGHLDAIHAPHEPPHYSDGRIYGRGAADMKSGLAAAAEVVRVIVQSGVRLNGDILITAHSLHEAPWGRNEAVYDMVRKLIGKGQLGDSVVVMEGATHQLPVIGKGLSIFEADIRREGEAVHEVFSEAVVPHPILVGTRLVQALMTKNAEFAQVSLPYVGPETYFVGIFQAGDFYNRIPTSCHIVGTRRYSPERTFAEVEAEARAIAAQIAREEGIEIRLKLTKQRDGFRLDPEKPMAVALRNAYALVHGRPLPLGGIKAVADAPPFMEAGVPAVYHGPNSERAHADIEYVALADVVNAAKVYLLTAKNYLGMEK